VRPEQTVAEFRSTASLKPTMKAFPDPRLVPHVVLYTQLERNPQYSVDHLADRLAARNGWSTEERNIYRSRLDDIQQTRLMAVLSEKSLAPSGSNPVAMQSYLDNLDARAEDARLRLNDIEDLN